MAILICCLAALPEIEFLAKSGAAASTHRCAAFASTSQSTAISSVGFLLADRTPMAADPEAEVITEVGLPLPPIPLGCRRLCALGHIGSQICDPCFQGLDSSEALDDG